MVTWSCLGFQSDLFPTSTSLAWSLTPSSPSKTMCVVLFPMPLREFVFWGWWTFICGHLCVTLFLFCICSPAILDYFSPEWGSLLNVIFSFLIAMCIQWPGFVLIRVSCRCVIDVELLGLVCCTRLMRTLITLCSASFHLLLLEFDIPELRPQIIHWVWIASLCRTFQFARCYLPAQVRMWNELPYTLCLTPECWMGSRVQSTFCCFPELCFLQYSVEQVLMGLRKQFINHFVFPLRPVLLVLIIIIVDIFIYTTPIIIHSSPKYSTDQHLTLRSHL